MVLATATCEIRQAREGATVADFAGCRGHLKPKAGYVTYPAFFMSLHLALHAPGPVRSAQMWSEHDGRRNSPCRT